MNWIATYSYIAAWALPSIALFMQNQSHFSWLQGFLIPVLFTLFGAVLGFLTSALHDDWNAKRAEQSFARAIGMELDALGNQLDASLQEVRDSVTRMAHVSNGPHFAFAMRTSVFTSQVGKLRDAADPLIIEIIHFYSDLSTLPRIFENVNEFSADDARATSDVQKSGTRDRLNSAITTLQMQISGFGNRLRALRSKLPPAVPPKVVP